MDTQQILHTAEEILKEWTIEIRKPEENRIDVFIAAKDIKSAVKSLLIDGHWGYLTAITGMDCPEYVVDPDTNEKKADSGKGKLELLYHFVNEAAVTTLRVELPYENTQIDSICDLIPTASFFEREVVELLGINIKDSPITSNLILPDSWPEGVYPLRKAFTGLPKEQGEGESK